LIRKLGEANEIIEGIKNGNIDAVFVTSSETAKILVSGSADLEYRKFIENMSEGVVTLHTDGIILYSNSSFARMVNFPLENVIGSNLRRFIPTEFLANMETLLTEHPTKSSVLELSIPDHAGSSRYFMVSLNSLELQDFVALNLVWTDVTDHKQAEGKLLSANRDLKDVMEERRSSENKVIVLNTKLGENIKTLEDANAELATFAHIASHDLQEPLRKILTYSSMLLDDYGDAIDERGRRHIDGMKRASRHMRNLISDILEYSQISKNSFPLASTDLQSVFQEVFVDIELSIQETKAKIILEGQLPVIDANSGQMKQLFRNLMSNALKFTLIDIIPEIRITFKIMTGQEIETSGAIPLSEKYCRIYIRDNGIGFNPEYADRIFTIFQKLNSGSVFEGTGIGLAICKKIVDMHHGFITAESRPDQGALFIITLPVSQVIRNKFSSNGQKQHE
jgi:two-component system CheB/CheR fusion protein